MTAVRQRRRERLPSAPCGRGARRAFVPTAEPLEARLFYAAVPLRLGGEIRLNDIADLQSSRPSVAADGAGYYVAAWQSGGQGGSERDVSARRFGTSDVTPAAPFRVNAHIAGDQTRPAVAASSNSWVIVWQSDGQDGDRGGVFGQMFGSGGSPLGFEFRVNTVTTGHQGAPSVAMAPDGRFVVAWVDGANASTLHISARVFGPDGVPRGDSFSASPMGGLRTSPAAGMAADGRFVVAWEGGDTAANAGEIYARQFAPDASPQGDIIDVGAAASLAVREPAVGVGAGGDFVVAWQTLASEDPGGGGDANGDGSGYGIAARRFSAAGVPRGVAFRVNAYAVGDQASPAVSSAADGSFAVAWHGAGQDGDALGAYARLYDADGAPVFDEIRANAAPEGNQSAAAVSLDADRRFVVAWQNDGPDGSRDGVYAQRFAADAPPVDPPPLSVTGVFVAGKAWTPAFRARLAAAGTGSDPFGFLVGDGPAQGDKLPWVGLNQVSVRFNRDVVAHRFSLVLGGVAVADYPSTLIEYDPGQFIFMWTFGRTFPADRLTLRLKGDGLETDPDVVRDASTGRPLDGDWADGRDAYPSGDGTSGGDFVFSFNVLPGDVNRDGSVDPADARAVRSRENSVLSDVNGSGAVDAVDYAWVRGRQRTVLPVPLIAASVGRTASPRSEPPRRQIFGMVRILE